MNNEDRQMEICPFCNVDMTDNQLMYVEVGCSNYMHYTKGPQGEWYVSDEINGDNPSESYYACRSCGNQLPVEYQEYYENNI